MEDFVVWGAPGSPYVRSALLTLEEKGASWRLGRLGFGESRGQAHLERHPFGKMPVLDHGDFRLYEAQAVLRYLDRVLPTPPLTPTDPEAAARMDQALNIADWYLFPSTTIGVAFQRVVAPRFGLPVDEAKVTEAKPEARRCLAELARLLGDQAWFAGEALSLADLHLVGQLAFLETFDEGRELLAPHANLRAWLARLAARPSFAATTWERLTETAEAA